MTRRLTQLAMAVFASLTGCMAAGEDMTQYDVEAQAEELKAPVRGALSTASIASTIKACGPWPPVDCEPGMTPVICGDGCCYIGEECAGDKCVWNHGVTEPSFETQLP